MNPLETGVAAHIGQEALAFLQGVEIGVAGAGGLGSNCAMHLVRSGFKRFVLADFDRVEASNLNRQFFFPDQVGAPKVEALARNLLALNPDLRLETHGVRVDVSNAATLFGPCDAVVECLDDPGAKKELAETLLPTGKLLVTASGVGGCGDSDRIRIRRIRPGFLAVGDEATECTPETPPLSPVTGLAAAKQADEILAHFLNLYKGRNHA